MEGFTKPEWAYEAPDGHYVSHLSVIEKDIFLVVASGYSHRDDILNAEEIYETALDEFLPSDAPYYLIYDLSKATGSSRGARIEHLDFHIKHEKRTSLLIYSDPDNSLSAMIKTGRLFSATLRDRVHIAQTVDEALEIIAEHRNPVTESDAENETRFVMPKGKKKLKALVLKQRREMRERQRDRKNKMDALASAIGHVTWGDSTHPRPVLNHIPEDDEFSDLHSSFQLLPADLKEMEVERGWALDELRKFKTITDRGNSCTVIADLAGHILYVNDSCARVHGYSTDELLGKHLHIFHNEAQLPRVDKLIEEGVKTGKFTNKEVYHVKKDGSAFPMLMSGVVIEGDKGTQRFMAATAIDISGRVAAENDLVGRPIGTLFATAAEEEEEFTNLERNLLTREGQRIPVLLSGARMRHRDAGGKGYRGKIAIRTRFEDERLILSVEDNGCGFDRDRADSLFQHGYTTKSTGSGIGLHSAALFVDSLGGSIRAESEGENRGARMVITLPQSGKGGRPSPLTRRFP